MPQDEQDRADVARVLAGDNTAFAGIVQRWQTRLVGLAWQYSRNRATAEDMAQEVFVKVFRSLGTFRGQSAFSTWLTAVAVNTFRTRLRTERWPEFALEHTPASAARTALEDLEDRQRTEFVQRAVLTLPPRYRDAILLFYFEEKDVAEAARVLDVSEGTLKSRLHRGRELLRRRCQSLQSSGAETAPDASLEES